MMEIIDKLFKPVKIDSLLILKQPVTTANSRVSFVLSADSKTDRINESISG